MSFGFHPYSKEDQLKIKEKPKINKKRYPNKKRKKKNPLKEIYKGRVIPKESTRGRITRKEYNKALTACGEQCLICGTTVGLEAHHVKFRSQGGRGKWRNIRFLCSDHHRGKYSPHFDESVRASIEKIHINRYGEYFWADPYDLYKLGLIPNTTEKAFEQFMVKESERLEATKKDLD